MKAVGYLEAGAIDRPDALIDVELPVPEPGPDFECMRECRQANMPRAVSPEVIDEDCRRTCTTPH